MKNYDLCLVISFFCVKFQFEFFENVLNADYSIIKTIQVKLSSEAAPEHNPFNFKFKYHDGFVPESINANYRQESNLKLFNIPNIHIVWTPIDLKYNHDFDSLAK
jgi:hypothetical protein